MPDNGNLTETNVEKDALVVSSAVESLKDTLILTPDQEEALKIFLRNYLTGVEQQRKQTESLEIIANNLPLDGGLDGADTVSTNLVNNDMLTELQLLRADQQENAKQFNNIMMGITGFWIGVILIYMLLTKALR